VSNADHQPVRLRVHRGISGGRRGARDVLSDQPPIWSSKPDVNAFEKIENDRLETAKRSIDRIVAVKGAENLGNPCRTTMKPSGKSMPPLLLRRSWRRASRRDVRDRATAMTRQGERRPDRSFR